MLFSELFIPPALRDAVSERAWIGSMLEAEAALAQAEARVGVIPSSAAEQIAAHCWIEQIDQAAIVVEARRVGNPVEPLARALRSVVPDESARYVHFGATSQDILDTASMLIARNALTIIERDLASLAGRLAELADEHRATLMVSRTLLQHALPITFGLKAAQWLAGVTRARMGLHRLHTECLAAQLGGAAGTLAALGDAGTAVVSEYARMLGLAEPQLPWHTERSRLLEIGAALGPAAGAVDKIALDLALLAQTEVQEVAEGGAEPHGGSSTMPHKRNPVGSVLARACAREAQPNIDLLLRSMGQEHERAAGAWHAEWQALTAALAFTGGAVSWLVEVMTDLEVFPDRMRENFDMTQGLVMTERVTFLLAERMDRGIAHEMIRAASGRAAEEGSSLKTVLMSDHQVRRHLSAEEIDLALDPTTYLGSTRAFIERALALHRQAERTGSAS
jgi:3-carboxy-cis,cis-muconate cycloisomerase